MSFPLGTKVRLVQSWRTYSAGAVLEQGYHVDLESLVRMGVAEEVKSTSGMRGAVTKAIKGAAKRSADLLG